MHDVVIVGAGPAGLTAAIAAAAAGASVLVLESGPKPGRKLLASGGGRCNVTNTLPAAEFMERFGRFGRFMQPALDRFGSDDLREFLGRFGVETHAPDGFHVFPADHDARSVLDALVNEIFHLGGELRTDSPVTDLVVEDGHARGVVCESGPAPARSVILASGGRGYRALGGGRSGYLLAQAHGHRVMTPYPGMVALVVRENWPARCIADTVPRAKLSVRRPGKSRITGTGDLIFTRTGLAGPVILDLSREITPLIVEAGEVALDLELTGRSRDEWLADLERARDEEPRTAVATWLSTNRKIAASLAAVFCEQAIVDPGSPLERLGRGHRNQLAAALTSTRVTVTGHAGWDHAMVTRGGVSLRDVRPETLESRLVAGLFLAGEMLDLDGPCGGFNLQWAFASGHLAGSSAARG